MCLLFIFGGPPFQQIFSLLVIQYSMCQKSETVFLVITILSLLTLSASPRKVSHSRLSPASSKDQESFRVVTTKHSDPSQTINQKEIAGIIAVVFIICIALFFISLRSKAKLNKKKSMPQDPNNLNHPKVLLLTQKEREEVLDELTIRPCLMIFTVPKKNETFHCIMKTSGLVQETQFIYRIKFAGKDELGKSTLKGVIIFQADRLKLKLSKVYDDKSNAFQEGKTEVMLFEGEGTPNKISGAWNFYGYDSQGRYEGNWQLSST